MIQGISSPSGSMMGMRGVGGRPDSQQAFQKIDGDGDGALSMTELQSMFDQMGNDAGSAEDIVASLDADGDGALSFAEFAARRPPMGGQAFGAGGMGGPGRGFGQMQQMDLSTLFGENEDDSESSYEEYYA